MERKDTREEMDYENLIYLMEGRMSMHKDEEFIKKPAEKPEFKESKDGLRLTPFDRFIRKLLGAFNFFTSR